MYERIPAPTTTIEIKQKALLAQARLSDALGGDLLSQDILLKDTSSVLSNLFLSLGYPSLQPREWKEGDLPFLEDYNSSQREVISDLNTIYTSISSLGSGGVGLFNMAEALCSRLYELEAEVEEELANKERGTYENTSGYFAPRGEVYKYSQVSLEAFLESFTSLRGIDVGQTTAAIHTDLGIATLGLTQEYFVSGEPNTEVKITQQVIEGNKPPLYERVPTGIPGNNLEVAGSALSFQPTNQTPVVELVSHSHPHNILRDMIDGSPDSWFEYERCNVIANPLPLTKCGSAWVSVDGSPMTDIYSVIAPDEWLVQTRIEQTGEIVTTRAIGDVPTTDGRQALRLLVTIDLPQERTINAIDINPKSFERGRHHYFYLYSLQVFSGMEESGGGEVLSSPLLITDATRFSIAPRKVRKIFFYLSQEQPAYLTLLGHYFVEATCTITESSSSSVLFGLFSSSDTETYTRVTRQSSIQAAYALQSASGDSSSTLFGLWGSSDSRSVNISNITTGYDIFKGKRWAIGISDLNAVQVQYEQQSQIVSQEYTFKNPITSLWVQSWDTSTIIDTTPTSSLLQYNASLGETGGESSSFVDSTPEEGDATYTGFLDRIKLLLSDPMSIHVLPKWSIKKPENKRPVVDTYGKVLPLNIPQAAWQVSPFSSNTLHEKTSVRYFLSVEGSEWKEVKAYGTGTGDVLDLSTFTTPVRKVRVRILLGRSTTSEDEAGYSPTLYGYQLVGATVEEKV